MKMKKLSLVALACMGALTITGCGSKGGGSPQPSPSVPGVLVGSTALSGFQIIPASSSQNQLASLMRVAAANQEVDIDPSKPINVSLGLQEENNLISVSIPNATNTQMTFIASGRNMQFEADAINGSGNCIVADYQGLILQGESYIEQSGQFQVSNCEIDEAGDLEAVLTILPSDGAQSTSYLIGGLRVPSVSSWNDVPMQSWYSNSMPRSLNTGVFIVAGENYVLSAEGNTFPGANLEVSLTVLQSGETQYPDQEGGYGPFTANLTDLVGSMETNGVASVSAAADIEIALGGLLGTRQLFSGGLHGQLVATGFSETRVDGLRLRAERSSVDLERYLLENYGVSGCFFTDANDLFGCFNSQPILPDNFEITYNGRTNASDKTLAQAPVGSDVEIKINLNTDDLAANYGYIVTMTYPVGVSVSTDDPYCHVMRRTVECDFKADPEGGNRKTEATIMLSSQSPIEGQLVPLVFSATTGLNLITSGKTADILFSDEVSAAALIYGGYKDDAGFIASTLDPEASLPEAEQLVVSAVENETYLYFITEAEILGQMNYKLFSCQKENPSACVIEYGVNFDDEQRANILTNDAISGAYAVVGSDDGYEVWYIDPDASDEALHAWQKIDEGNGDFRLLASTITSDGELFFTTLPPANPFGSAPRAIRLHACGEVGTLSGLDHPTDCIQLEGGSEAVANYYIESLYDSLVMLSSNLGYIGSSAYQGVQISNLVIDHENRRFESGVVKADNDPTDIKYVLTSMMSSGANSLILTVYESSEFGTTPVLGENSPAMFYHYDIQNNQWAKIGEDIVGSSNSNLYQSTSACGGDNYVILGTNSEDNDVTSPYYIYKITNDDYELIDIDGLDQEQVIKFISCAI